MITSAEDLGKIKADQMKAQKMLTAEMERVRKERERLRREVRGTGGDGPHPCLDILRHFALGVAWVGRVPHAAFCIAVRYMSLGPQDPHLRAPSYLVPLCGCRK